MHVVMISLDQQLAVIQCTGIVEKFSVSTSRLIPGRVRALSRPDARLAVSHPSQLPNNLPVWFPAYSIPILHVPISGIS
jgi:hypothetical protein